MLITSPQNERIKACARLDKRSERDSRGLTRVEGLREITSALEAGVTPVEAFLCREIAQQPSALRAITALERLAGERRTRLLEVTPEVFARLALREESGGIVLVVPNQRRTLDALPAQPTPFFCVVEGVEKPGNLGAILRSADGAGVDAVIVTEGATDLHNPNVIRASLGAFFSLPLCEASAVDTVRFLQTRGIAIVAAHPNAARVYTEVDLCGPVAIVMGAEAQGLSELWRNHADLQVYIPMRGRVDSLNLATATALMLYEVVRQRISNRD